MDTTTLQHALVAVAAVVAIVGYVRWEMFLIHDISGASDVRYPTSPAWIALCLICIPVGGILYLVYGRTR